MSLLDEVRRITEQKRKCNDVVLKEIKKTKANNHDDDFKNCLEEARRWKVWIEDQELVTEIGNKLSFPVTLAIEHRQSGKLLAVLDFNYEYDVEIIIETIEIQKFSRWQYTIASRQSIGKQKITMTLYFGDISRLESQPLDNLNLGQHMAQRVEMINKLNEE